MCFCPRTVADRPGRSTAWVDRTLAVDRRAQAVHVWQTQGRSAGRPTGPESSALCLFRSAGRSTGLPNGHISDRWRSAGPADR